MDPVDHEVPRSPGTPAPVNGGEVPGLAAVADCCGRRALFGWSPPALPADTVLKRRVDATMPRSGVALVIFYAVVIALLTVGVVLPRRLDLIAVGLASLAAGCWCALNFWRCRHAHCLVTGVGWLVLAAFTFVEASLDRSMIHGDEGLVFLGVLGAGLVAEGVWYMVRGTNAIAPRSA